MTLKTFEIFGYSIPLKNNLLNLFVLFLPWGLPFFWLMDSFNSDSNIFTTVFTLAVLPVPGIPAIYNEE